MPACNQKQKNKKTKNAKKLKENKINVAMLHSIYLLHEANLKAIQHGQLLGFHFKTSNRLKTFHIVWSKLSNACCKIV